ncbi:hypothetical protein ACN47E_006545 [Coniothyrium glycines]
MSSLTAGHVLSGGKWNYRILEMVHGDKSHTSTVYKAEVMANKDSHDVPQWSFIKGASNDNTIAMEDLNRECQSYLLPGIATPSCFRKLYDVVDTVSEAAASDRYMALEWLETTLAQVKYQPGKDIDVLVEKVLSATLHSCVVLDGYGLVNTDFKPANLLLSGVGTSQITAKVGDLGLVFPSGQRFFVQPFAMRAPEVYLGHACTSSSQVWAIAATLLCWIRPRILGVSDSPHSLIHEAWSMAKLKRLFPHWHVPAPDEVDIHRLKHPVEYSVKLSEQVPELLDIPPLEQMMQAIEMPQELRDVLRLMMAVDPGARPCASSVLASREFRTFQEYVSV